MRSMKNVGRAVGIALLIPMLLSPPLYSVWLGPFRAADYLARTSGSPMQIRLALLLLLGFGTMTLTVAILAIPVFRRYSERMATAFLAMSLLALVTIVIEASALRDMLALSAQYATVGAPKELLETLGALARTTRLGAHFTNLVFTHATMFLLHLMLFRFAIVPRALSAAGMAACAVSTVAVTLPLLGQPLATLMVAPMGVTSFALALWLIFRGFRERTVAPGGNT